MAARDGTGCWLPMLTHGQGASVLETSIATLTSCVTPSLITVACMENIDRTAYLQTTTTIVQLSHECTRDQHCQNKTINENSENKYCHTAYQQCIDEPA